MEEPKKGFNGLEISKNIDIFYKQDAMAQISLVIKKLKKNKKLKSSELADMYNEKCVALCETIETNKIALQNYKDMIYGLQKNIDEKDKEIKSLKLDIVKKDELLNQGEEKIKKLNASVNVVPTSNFIKTGEDSEEQIIQKLQSKIIELNREKNEFNLKMIEKENEYKALLKQKDEKIKELLEQMENIKNNNNNKINIDKNEIKIDEKEEEKEDKEEKEEKKEEKDEEKISENKIDDEIKDVIIPNQETTEHKLMIFNKVMTENLFMIYLLERCPSLGKILKELVGNFDKYATIFIRDNLKVNNIFSNVLYEFIYRSYRRTDLNEFAVELFDNNSISRSEDFKSKILENDYYSKGFINEYQINELNFKIKDYKNETFNNIKALCNKVREFIRDTPQLEYVRKFDPSALYSFNKSRLKINLTLLNPNTIGYLVTGIKYNKEKIKYVEFSGELNYDRNDECKYTHEVFYQLLMSHGEEIKELSFNGIKKFSLYKLLSLSYSTNFFIKGINILLKGCPKIKNVIVNNCEITDDHINDFEFQPNYNYDIINFANNKIYKLKSFEKIVATQLILSRNKIKFYQGDNNLSFIYLDISGNDISLKDFNRYMNESKVQILNLSDIRILKEDEGVQVSNALSSMRQLKIIYLNNCQIQEKSLKHILNVLNREEILELYLSGNPLGDECMPLLSDFILKCKALVKIDLSNTKITNEGVQKLVEGINDNESIKELNLEKNPNLDKNTVIEMFKDKENFKVNV